MTGRLELSDDGKAMKYFELVPFELWVTAETVVDALAHDIGRETAVGGPDGDSGTQALETEQSDL